MSLLLDSFWRALAYCLHPRVVLLSLLPVLLMAGGVFALGYYLWYPAQAWLITWLEGWQLLAPLQAWLDQSGLGALASVLAPLLLLVLATPLLVLLALLLVGLFMTPAMVKLVALRRFAHLERRRGASFLDSLWWALGSTLLALLALLATLPLWLVPPLALLLPPLIWGWLGYRVYAFDALSEHADAAERSELLARHRSRLWLMGLSCGLLGAAPSLLWTSGAMFIAMAPLLVPLAVWVYALVFAFSSLWFAHYLLAALAGLRATRSDSAPSLPA
jgi:Etoposide-induced protein 2.4 (EI24)